MVNNILINFPSNIGDAILSLPALDLMRANYPAVKITAIVSPRTREFLSRHSAVDQSLVYDKHWPLGQKVDFCRKLRGGYDLIADFKHSLLPFILGVKRHTPMFRRRQGGLHLKERNIKLISELIADSSGGKGYFIFSREEMGKWKDFSFTASLFVATTSKWSDKNYPQDKLKIAVERLARKYPIVLIGEEKDMAYYQNVSSLPGGVSLVGRTSFYDVCYLLDKYAMALLSVDTGIMHLASYLNLPVIALFGPTKPFNYEPWSDNHKTLTAGGKGFFPYSKGYPYKTGSMDDISPECVETAVDEVISKIKKNDAR
ncbi:MAG: glycosyltransferase family 9 protein [Candidatus Omnitrophota bacterium]